MPRYVAFLRAINVGGHTVKMDRLRGLFEELDLRNVKTLIASGNVLFDSTARSTSALEKRIEDHLERSLGYEVTTFIRTPSELARICEFRPVSMSKTEFEARGLYVSFLKAAPGEDTRRKVLALCTDADALYFNEREMYWSCATKMSESPLFGTLLGKTLKIPMTMRNVTTVRRLAATP